MKRLFTDLVRETHLLKSNTEINVYGLSCTVVHKDIKHVPIAKPEDMPDDRGRRDAAGVVQAHRKP